MHRFYCHIHNFTCTHLCACALYTFITCVGLIFYHIVKILNTSLMTDPWVSLLKPHPSLSCPISKPLIATNLFSTFKCLSFQKCYINEIIQLSSFGIGFFSLSLFPWRFIQVVVCINIVLLLLLSSIAWHNIPQFN